ncbi:hypothetical protein CEXT_377841 [Caerostris extrusa]|uniref:Uncharacterized protein n=1 Tax=Caerostris extrusa TaxID=172846 RepID=A0AAV4VMC7_CAEEX|nr:hypothetical protein CEXT_377841 [Caerostris extrusa]
MSLLNNRTTASIESCLFYQAIGPQRRSKPVSLSSDRTAASIESSLLSSDRTAASIESCLFFYQAIGPQRRSNPVSSLKQSDRSVDRDPVSSIMRSDLNLSGRNLFGSSEGTVGIGDADVPVMEYLCSSLHVPGNSWHILEAHRDKYLIREQTKCKKKHLSYILNVEIEMPKHAFNRPSTYTTNHESSKCDSKFMHANCEKGEICYGRIWSEESVSIEQASNPRNDVVCGEETSDENLNLRKTEYRTHYEDSTRKIPKELSTFSPLEAAINRSPRSFNVKSLISKINNAVLVQTGVSSKLTRQLANSYNIHRTSFVPQNTFVDHSNSSQTKHDESLPSNPFDLTTKNSSREDGTLRNGVEVINLDQIKTVPRGKDSDVFLELSDNFRKDIFNQEINFPEMQDKRKGFCLLSDTLKMDRHYLPCAVKTNPKLHPDTTKSERVVNPYASETGRDFNMRQSNAQIDLIAGHVDPFIIEHCDVQPPRISKDFPINSSRGDGSHTQKYCVWENLNQNELSFKDRDGKHKILPRNIECKSDYQKSSHLIEEGMSIDYIDSSTQTPNCEEMPDYGENTLTSVANSEDTFTCMRCLMCFWPLAVGAIVGAGIHSLITGDRSENLCIC